MSNLVKTNVCDLSTFAWKFYLYFVETCFIFYLHIKYMYVPSNPLDLVLKINFIVIMEHCTLTTSVLCMVFIICTFIHKSHAK